MQEFLSEERRFELSSGRQLEQNSVNQSGRLTVELSIPASPSNNHSFRGISRDFDPAKTVFAIVERGHKGKDIAVKKRGFPSFLTSHREKIATFSRREFILGPVVITD